MESLCLSPSNPDALPLLIDISSRSIVLNRASFSPSPSGQPAPSASVAPSASPSPGGGGDEEQLQKQIDDALAQLDKIRAELNADLSSSTSAASPTGDINQSLSELDQTNIEGVENIGNQAFDQYFKILPQ